MKSVGRRVARQIALNASGALLAEGARFSETLARLASVAHVPKGVCRFASHEQVNRHEQDCLVRAMASLAWERRRGRVQPRGHAG
jgi:hypothetical protein